MIMSMDSDLKTLTQGVLIASKPVAAVGGMWDIATIEMAALQL